MTKQEYFVLCARHDWFYDYSDDHSVWRRGNDMQKIIREVSREMPDYEPIYKAWVSYINALDTGNKLPVPKLEDFV